MTTRNFRVNNGLSVGDITINASTNKIEGLSTGAPSADGDVVTKAYSDSGTQTMTNKTLTSAVLNTGVSGTAILDEDTLSSNSDTQLATQQSIKAYVDTEIGNISTVLTVSDDSSTSDSVTIGIDTLNFAGGTGITSVVTDNTVTFNIDSTVATLTGSQVLTNKTINSSSNTLTISGSEATLSNIANG